MKLNFCFLLNILLIYLYNVYGKITLIIRNNTESFSNLQEYINSYISAGHGEEIIVKFVDSYYQFSKLNTFSVNIFSYNINVTLSGNDEGTTVFDYNNAKTGSINFVLYKNIVKFENIIFENYHPYDQSKIYVLGSVVEYDDFQLIVNNCTFRNNDYELIQLWSECKEKTQDTPQYLFTNCNFYNNNKKILHTVHHLQLDSKTKYEDKHKCAKVKYINCNFNNNRGLIYSKYFLHEFENCYISNLYEYFDNEDGKNFVLLHTKTKEEYISFKNTTFENINVDSLFPLINSEGLTLKIEGSNFRNCFTNYNCLFNIKNSHNTIEVTNTNFTNSGTIFCGDTSEVKISNSNFDNIVSKSTIPAISRSKNTNIIIEGTTFSNFSLIGKLFEEESNYNFTNVKFKDIKSNGKAFLLFLHNNITINNVEIENASCVGDSGDTSFIIFDTGESEKSLNINNLNLKNSLSNGPFIKIKGFSSKVTIKNSNINNVRSYGSVIENTSIKAYIEMTNFTFYNNVNNYKYECGIIHFQNDLDILIEDSTFYDNHSKSNGGAICLDNISHMNIKLISNEFKNNRATNGGAIYLANGINTNEKNEEKIYIERNIFHYNIAENFGGAIYSEYDKLYETKAKNNEIIMNKAGIMGGGVYTPKFINKNMFKLNSDWKLSNNTVSSEINDYTTMPSYIVLETDMAIENNEISVISGNYIPLNFELYDEYNNIITDVTKYYSDIALKLNLELEPISTESNSYEIDNKNSNNIFSLLNNKCTFIKGRCEFKFFIIRAVPRTYYLKVDIENKLYHEEINFKFNNIKINILPCSDNQIKMYDQKGFLYCENPICDSSCPTNSTAVCFPSNKELVNDINLNQCVCLNGWEGSNCDVKVFIDYSKISKKSKSSNPQNDKSNILVSDQLSDTSSWMDEMYRNYNKKIHSLNSLFCKSIYIYLVFLLTLFIIIIVYASNDDDNIQQSKHGNWYYKCKLERSNFGLNILYLILLILFLNIGRSISKYRCIYTYIRYITYSMYFSIISGPLISIFISSIFDTLPLEGIYVNTFFNSLCFIVTFVLLSWNKIYYICKKQGDDSTLYFIYKNHDLCSIHNSTYCGCKLKNMSKDELLINIDKYIEIYKICSDFFEQFRNN
ncbi:hypothetical protein BCR32DRAFT_273406 [Anaeromyces robustus]|uniref:EGF-like domain-containing protein n=1 Tax=Anaeromyces robustus TaxID=1754192 RepID=A0A1Y1VQE6_9FUNG|nr:hypothetical protein BCR32DRAFT_273406 [Anaeromyces robustus]|eukprot:ORX63531.1 hypothetical protein BCR32DRAFT_273406 [Anaeromyces robustus]